MQISNACPVDYRCLHMQPWNSNRKTMVKIPSIKNDCFIFMSCIFLHRDEYTIKGMQSHKYSLPSFPTQSQPKLNPDLYSRTVKAWLKFSRESNFVPTFNQVSAAYSVLTWHEGGVKQQGAAGTSVFDKTPFWVNCGIWQQTAAQQKSHT